MGKLAGGDGRVLVWATPPTPSAGAALPHPASSNGPAARCGEGGVQSGARSLAASEGSPMGHSHPLVSAQHSLDSERPRRPLHRPPPPCAALYFDLPWKGRETRVVWKTLPIVGRPCHFLAPLGDCQVAGSQGCSELRPAAIVQMLRAGGMGMAGPNTRAVVPVRSG